MNRLKQLVTVITTVITTLSLMAIVSNCNKESNTQIIYIEKLQPEFSTITELDSEPVIEITNEVDIIPKVNYTANCGTIKATDAVYIASDTVLEKYKSEYIKFDWDVKNRINTIEALWDFLVIQNNVNPKIAAGILGNIAVEGTFGQIQGSFHYVTSLEDLYESSKGKGVGIAQWTSKSRQEILFQYYRESAKLYADDWEMTCVAAECAMLLEELKICKVYKDLQGNLSIEDACGRMAVLFEKYGDVSDDWSKVDGHYICDGSAGSGRLRLQYAKDIYNHFMGI